jgi:hypothetical protein
MLTNRLAFCSVRGGHGSAAAGDSARTLGDWLEGGRAMASGGQIAEAVNWLGSALDEVERPEAARDAGGALAELAVRFQWLREQYRASPGAFAPHVGRLTALRQRFNALASRMIEQIVDRYHELATQVQALEREKETWRDLLITTSLARQVDLHGRRAVVHVRTTEARNLPAAGSPNRTLLEQMLSEAGCWREVAQLSATKLQTAIARHALPQSCAAAVERLCPRTQRHTVLVRERGSAAGGSGAAAHGTGSPL